MQKELKFFLSYVDL